MPCAYPLAVLGLPGTPMRILERKRDERILERISASTTLPGRSDWDLASSFHLAHKQYHDEEFPSVVLHSCLALVFLVLLAPLFSALAICLRLGVPTRFCSFSQFDHYGRGHDFGSETMRFSSQFRS